MTDFMAEKPPVNKATPSLKKTIAVFGLAFVVIMLLLNLPTIVSAVSYPLTHSQESENERLTAQYRSLYGYEHQRELTALIVPTASPKSQTDTLSIQAIGVSAPIIQVPSTDDATVLPALKKGVVLYPGSANPASGGATVIVGHSSSDLPWTKYSNVFALLDKLQVNDVIKITFQGREYSYAVQKMEHGSVAQILDSGVSGDLILSSCWPVGTDQGRIVVVANLLTY